MADTSSLADWATVASGVATVLLAGLTVVLALSTRRASAAAADASKLAQLQLQESVRPLLVPQPPREDPDDPARTLLPVRNIGVGAALNLYAVVQAAGQPKSVLGRFPESKVAGVAPGETGHLTFNAASVTSRTLGKVRLMFSDVAGQNYATEALWDRRRGAYRHLNISERKRLRLERIPPPSGWQRLSTRLKAGVSRRSSSAESEQASHDSEA